MDDLIKYVTVDHHMKAEADTVIVTLKVTPLCMRRKDDENAAKSKESERSSSKGKCDGGTKKTTKKC